MGSSNRTFYHLNLLLLLLPVMPAMAQGTWLKIMLGVEQTPEKHLKADQFPAKHPQIIETYKSQPSAGIALSKRFKNNAFCELSAAGRNSSENEYAIISQGTSGGISGLAGIGKTKGKMFDIRAEYALSLAQVPRYKTIQPYLGLFLGFNTSSLNYAPAADSSFHLYKLSDKSRRASMGVTPRILFELGPRWALDLNASIFLFNLAYNQAFIDNPLFSPSQKEFASFDFSGLRGYQIRLGLCYRLLKGK